AAVEPARALAVSLYTFLFCYITRPPPAGSTLFPYTTLFRSRGHQHFRSIVGGIHLSCRTAPRRWRDRPSRRCRSRPDATSRSTPDRKSTRLNSSHVSISYAVFCLKKKRQARRLYQWVGWP